MKERLKGGQRSNWDNGRLREVQAFWHWRDIPCRDANEFGITAPRLPVCGTPRDYAISLLELGDIGPRLLHDTGGIHAGNEWKPDFLISIASACALTRACFRVSRIDPRIADPD